MADVLVKLNLVAVTNPSASDDVDAGYSVYSTWVNTATNAAFMCVDNSAGASVWKQISFSFSTLNELNAVVTDATLIDTGDSRLSDARTPLSHAASHTDGSDDVQSATNAQKGLATAAQITTLEANAVHAALVAGNPHAVTKSEVGLGSVENTALSTWGGSSNIVTVGTIVTGTWSASTIAIDKGGTGQTTAQAAIDALTQVAGATDEHVLTKDTATGNAVFKAAAGGGVTDHGALTGLGDDDHTQYHNDARGDARYSLLAHTHSAFSQDTAGFATGPTASDISSNYVLQADGDWVANAGGGGGGDVTKVGTPVDNQIAVWTDDGTVEGDAKLTWSPGLNIKSTGTSSIPLEVKRSSADIKILDILEGAGGAGNLRMFDLAGTQSFMFAAGANTESYINSSPGAIKSMLMLGRTSTSRSATLEIAAHATSTRGIVVKGMTGHTAALQEWRDGSDVLRSYINNDGSLWLGDNSGAPMIRGKTASGTDSTGADLILASGISTGAATPAKGKLQGTVAATSGSTAQTLVDVLTWDGNGVTSVKPMGFNGTAPIAKPTVTGSRGSNAALASLLTALANLGLVTDSSS